MKIPKKPKVAVYYKIGLPPIGAPKQQEMPTAQAAANISLFLDSFS